MGEYIGSTTARLYPSPLPTSSTQCIARQEPRPERIEVDDGLVMQWSTCDDAKNVADCLAEAFKFPSMSGRHVVMSEYDIALVEDTTLHHQTDPKTGKPRNPVVAAICMQQMAGYYGSVPITYGALGAVGSLPAYRNRGLIRRLFLEMMHPVADARGDLMTFIISIPHFYRLFGYEYAVPYKFGRQLMDFATTVPPLAAGGSEPFTLHPVTSKDLPYLVHMTTPERLHCNAQLGIYYGQDFWRYIIEELSPDKIENYHDAHHHAGIVVDLKTDRDIGVSMTSNNTGRWDFDRPYYEYYNTKLNNNTLPNESDKVQRQRGQFPLTFSNLIVNLTRHHPVTKLLDSQDKFLQKTENPPVRLYTRIHSLPKWIEKIAPVIEERLKFSEVFRSDSARLRLEGMTGRGLEVVFRKGRFVSASDWKPKGAEEIMREKYAKQGEKKKQEEDEEVVYIAGFAPLTFTRLVAGTIDASELLQRDSENYVSSGETKLMLEVLFPRLEHFVDLEVVDS
ncbi:hypothetical protein BGZ65_001520 [Modicella reniformis]|uniref:N-acetyltransferase domain-containing protein n=1 Tax=Modicella reniformis TaxID=1440133 RepID=A0A9P6MA15_9FUNG|nr:hypothetical protein BGZ65_001520 [Modicella reniformis]